MFIYDVYKPKLYIRYAVGKKGDVIITDRNIKSKLGEVKHIVLKPGDKAKKFLEFISTHYENISDILKRCLVKTGESSKVVFYRVLPPDKCRLVYTVRENAPREPELRKFLKDVSSEENIINEYYTILNIVSDYENGDNIVNKKLVVSISPSVLSTTQYRLDKEMIDRWLPIMRRKWKEILQKYGATYPRAVLHSILRDELIRAGMPKQFAYGYWLPIRIETQYDLDKLNKIINNLKKLANKYGYKLEIINIDSLDSLGPESRVYEAEYRYTSPNEFDQLNNNEKQILEEWLYLLGTIANYEKVPVGIERGIILGLNENEGQ